MKELNTLQMEEIRGANRQSICAALGFICGLAIGTGNALAAMGAVVAGYANGCY